MGGNGYARGDNKLQVVAVIRFESTCSASRVWPDQQGVEWGKEVHTGGVGEPMKAV